jgi:hypothetical protein
MVLVHGAEGQVRIGEVQHVWALAGLAGAAYARHRRWPVVRVHGGGVTPEPAVHWVRGQQALRPAAWMMHTNGLLSPDGPVAGTPSG